MTEWGQEAVSIAKFGNLVYVYRMNRREYSINITVNEISITKVIVDSHYEEKHLESMSDEIILELVKTLDGKVFEPDDEKEPYSYFVTDKIEFNNKLYKLI